MIKLNIGTASGWLQRLDGMKGAGELFKLTRLCKIQSFITKGRPHSRPSQLKQNPVARGSRSVWTCTRGCTWRWRSMIISCPKAARRLRPEQFVPWVEELLRGGHTVHVVYEACGFGFSLYRQLMAVGAHCYVIAPRKLDEECTRVKTDPRDATTLCQRLSRYLEGNTRELAV